MSDKRFYKVVVVAATILIIMLVVGTIGAIGAAQVQGDDCIQLYVNGALAYESDACDVAEPTPTVEPTDAPTATAEPTVAPTNTPTPVPDEPVEPYPDAPECAEHDGTETHTLWNAVEGCYYNHSHGYDEQELVQFFEKWGLPLAYLEESTLALTVQTPNENELKHNGYRWFLYEVEDGCHKDDKGRFDKFGRVDNCVVAFAARLHDLGGVPAMTTKLHSVAVYTVACLDADDSLEVDVPDLDNCGWSYIEQVLAFGEEDLHELHAPYKQEFAVGFEGDGNLHSPPYIGTLTAEQCLSRSSRGAVCLSTWNSERDGNGMPAVLGFDYRNYDEWQGIYQSDPFHVDLLGGAYNTSERHVYEVVVQAPGSGTVTDSGVIPLCLYDDAPCQGEGRYELHDYPAGLSVYARADGIRPGGATFQDVDIYFDGVTSGWLEFYQP